MEKDIVKIVVSVPVSHAETVRRAMGEAGAGKIGNYDFCSFSSKGTGRFRPLSGANPAMGEAGKIEEVVEEQIQTVCYVSNLNKIISAIKKAHPYEVPAIDIIPLLNFDI